jgi:hypothetical protein
MSRPGVQHVVPAAHNGLPAAVLQGTAGALSATVGTLESAPASAGGLFDDDDELHATASATPTTVPTLILTGLMTRPPWRAVAETDHDAESKSSSAQQLALRDKSPFRMRNNVRKRNASVIDLYAR